MYTSFIKQINSLLTSHSYHILSLQVCTPYVMLSLLGLGPYHNRINNTRKMTMFSIVSSITLIISSSISKHFLAALSTGVSKMRLDKQVAYTCGALSLSR